MSAPFADTQGQWIGLGAAAHLLGVHFTTLRRWADGGLVSCIRTPGGRRRFSRDDLEQFLAQMRSSPRTNLPALLEARAAALARQQVQAQGLEREDWLARLGEQQRLEFRGRSQRMVALIIQFSGRSNSVGVFLEEGRRVAQGNGGACYRARLSVAETVSAFLFFRRSMLDAVHDTSLRGSALDAEGQRIYHRMRNFLDVLLVATVEGYCDAQASDALAASGGH